MVKTRKKVADPVSVGRATLHGWTEDDDDGCPTHPDSPMFLDLDRCVACVRVERMAVEIPEPRTRIERHVVYGDVEVDNAPDKDGRVAVFIINQGRDLKVHVDSIDAWLADELGFNANEKKKVRRERQRDEKVLATRD